MGSTSSMEAKHEESWSLRPELTPRNVSLVLRVLPGNIFNLVILLKFTVLRLLISRLADVYSNEKGWEFGTLRGIRGKCRASTYIDLTDEYYKVTQ